MKTETVVSDGNSKIGATPNVSLLPGLSCPVGVPCAKKCYCTKACAQYFGALKKWYSNSLLWRSNPKEFERQIMVYLEKKRSKYFRWAVAGDIPDVNYLRMMLRVARRFPDTKFLAFTKQYSILIEEYPDEIPNLTIIVSGWPGYRSETFKQLRDLYPASWVRLKGGEEATGVVLECPGKCEGCRRCWGLETHTTVEFKEH